MPGTPPPPREFRRALAAIALGLGALSLWLQAPGSAVGAFLARASFDTLTRLGALVRPAPADPAVAIVFLDLDSDLRLHQDPAAPWDRSLHARLLARLTAAGARLVVFDVVFGGPGPDPEGDAALTAAIRANGRVVLGAELNRSGREMVGETGFGLQTMLPPYEPFQVEAAGWGVTDVQVDEDFVPRRNFTGFGHGSPSSLAWVAAALYAGTNRAAATAPETGRWIRYYRPPLQTPHVSFADALDPLAVADSFFAGRVVFVGARPKTGLFRERRDEFPSPFGAWSQRNLFVPGVEVHATEFLNLTRGDGLRRMPAGAERVLLVVGALLWPAVFLRRRIAHGAALGVAAEVLVGVAALGAWLVPGGWFPWLAVAGVQIPAAFAATSIVQGADWYRQRRRFEARRRADDEKIREQATLIEKAQDAILVEDLSGRVVYANPAAMQLYGWTLPELQAGGPGVGPFAADPSGAIELRDRVRRLGEWSGEMAHVTRAGAALKVQSRWTLIRDAAGAPKSVLLVNTDVTEQRRLELEMLRAQRVEIIGSLANGVAHDLNNALSPVLLGIEFLRREIRSEDAGKVLAMMEVNTLRGADMLRQMLLFSRGDEGARETVNPARLLRDLELSLRPTLPRSIQLTVLVPRDAWPVRANPTELHQVLLNLCVNARDAMSAGGRMTLAADNVAITGAEAAAAEAAGGQPGDHVMLLVSDTGDGIPPELLTRIFEPFFTTKPRGQGTGLGLSTVRRIVQNHGGFLTVRSEPGAGTTFEVYLPRVVAPAVPEPLPPELAPVRGQEERVLVVHGDRSMRELMASCLGDAGYRIAVAPDLPDGLAALRVRGERARVIVIDSAAIPGSIADTLAPLLAQDADLSAVVLTDRPGPAEGVEPGLPRRCAVLAKPVRPEELLVRIRELTRPGL